MALEAGADVVIDKPWSEELLPLIKEACQDELPEIVIDTTGSAPVL